MNHIDQIHTLENYAGKTRPAEPLLYEMIIVPHSSLDSVLYKRLIACIFIVAGLAAFRFIFVGAWPVALFFIADVIAIWLAFYLFRRSAKRREIIILTKTSISLIRISAAGNRLTETFEPYWASVEISHKETGGPKLIIKSKDHIKEFGDFLNASDQVSAAQELNEKLVLWRAGSL